MTEAELQGDPKTVPDHHALGGMEQLEPARCVELLETTPIGRIAFWSGDFPLVLPVNFAWFQGGVVFRTLAGQKLTAATREKPVCFEVDQWNSGDRTGWSVVVQGVSREVTDWAEKEQLENLGLVPWTPDSWRRMWVRIDPVEISGRRIAERGTSEP